MEDAAADCGRCLLAAAVAEKIVLMDSLRSHGLGKRVGARLGAQVEGFMKVTLILPTVLVLLVAAFAARIDRSVLGPLASLG